MPYFAVHNGEQVLNVIVADTYEQAAENTELIVIETSGEPWVGWTLEDGVWKRPAPFPSWVWDGGVGDYVAPVPVPDDESGTCYFWDESALTWKPVP